MNKAQKASTEARARKRFINLPPGRVDEQNNLADEMSEWVSKQQVWNLDQFPISKKMAPSRFYNLKDNNEYFANALEYARRVISDRLIMGWKTKEVEKDFCLRFLPLYNQEYRDYVNEKIYNDAKGKAAGNFIVQQLPVEETDEVSRQLKKKGKTDSNENRNSD